MDRLPNRPQTESILDLLREDDARVADLLDLYDAALDKKNPRSTHERLAEQICDALLIQRKAEEEVLYPILSNYNDKLAFAFQLACQGISMRVAELRDSGKSKSERELAMARLIVKARRNLVERAKALLPFLHSRVPEAELRWLGAEFSRCKNMLRVVAERDAPASLQTAIPLGAWRQLGTAEAPRPH